MNLFRNLLLRMSSFIYAIAIILLLIIGYGFGTYWFTEKPVAEFCESLKVGMKYSGVIKEAKLVNNAKLNKFSLNSETVQLHSDTYLLGYICFMKFSNGILEKSYWHERG